MSGESKTQIPDLTSTQKKALEDGKTIRLLSSSLSPPRFSLRTRGYYPDEMHTEAGDALHTARTQGLHEKIKEFGQKRKVASSVIKAIGRKNRDRNLLPYQRMGQKEGNLTIPKYLSERIKQFDKDPISDLTKTSLGAESQRKRNFNKRSRNKNPQSAGKRKTIRRKNGGRKKNKKKTRNKKRTMKKRRRKTRRKIKTRK